MMYKWMRRLLRRYCCRGPRAMPNLSDWIAATDSLVPKPPPLGELEPHLRDFFDAHLRAINAFSPGSLEDRIRSELPRIEQLGRGVIDAVRHQLAGSPASAYRVFRDALAGVRRNLDDLLDDVPETRRLAPTYRMRVSARPRPFSREELFHIPFHLRRLVSSQRFSIEGLPCLYLGYSTYVCWEELLRPSFSSIYVAQFRFRHVAFRVLDLAYVPRFQGQLLLLWLQNGPNAPRLANTLVALTVLWPLIAACSVRTSERDAPFKPEYIVPQLLLQWIMEETDWHGIRYFSSRVGAPQGILTGANLVLPARRIGLGGHCDVLRGIFDVTEVWNWEMLLAVTTPMRSTQVTGSIEAAPDAFVDYLGSHFWRVESMLNERPAQPL
jgi:hypothetical protein